ncbi:GGDEF domain-containing protein [Pseudonocardia sp.]|uniref:sensor domain-containing diguanylate cyclase n=1 Tax=Pseudonocardia sp. TaxID=60912 RepID=UPI0026347C1E|nr:GGDEF domain-containing protein [Pseudonocardia sp.]
MPRRVLAVVVLIDLLAAGFLVLHARDDIGSLRSGWPWIVLVLAVAGIVSTEASLGVERMRRRTDESPHIDLSSVWALAAAILMPALVAGAVVAVLYIHIYLRIWRRSGVPLYRFLFSLATVMLAVQSADAVTHLLAGDDPFHSGRGLAAVLLALLAYAAVNMVLIATVIVMSGSSRTLGTFVQVMCHGDEAVLEFATLSMGVLVAGAVASFGPAYAVLVLPPLIVLHRTVLVRQLEEAASTDSKTGLLNAAAWHVQAGREMRRAERINLHATVLVLDLDHFKLVNDRHGHLVGDQVLAAVAAAVRAEVRDEDIVGRFGGEEFVVLLRGIEGDDGRVAAEAVAERIRLRVAALRVAVPGSRDAVVVDGLTVSIGGATLPSDGVELGELLEVADAAMYDAKHAGRNRVRMGAGTGSQARRR